MKAVVRSTVMTILVLFDIISASASAQAYFSAGQAREQSTAYVVSGDNSCDGDIIRTAVVQPDSFSLIPDWKAESGVEGREDIQNQSQGVTKEPRRYGRRTNGEQYDTNNKIPVDYPIQFLGWKSEHWLGEYKDVHYRGHGMLEEHGHNRHWVKNETDPAPTSIPSAALRLGSGLSILMIGRSVKFSKGQRRGELS